MKKVPDPDPAGQKSTDPTESGFSSLPKTQFGEKSPERTALPALYL